MTDNWLHKLGSMFWGETEAEDEQSTLHAVVERAEAHGRTEVMAGSIQLLGLNLVKEKLGDKWAKVAATAAAIAEYEIARLLGPTDFYRPVDDGYMLCLDTDDHKTAEAQVAQIAKAIETRLITEIIETEGSAAVRFFVSKVDTGAIRTGGDPARTLEAALSHIRKETGQGTQTYAAPKQSGILFQPTWPNQDFGSTKNRCVMDSFTGAAAGRHIASLTDPEAMMAAVADLDCMMLTKCAGVLQDMALSKKRVTLIVPVQFRTLAGRHRMDFTKLGRLLPPHFRKVLLLDVIGVPESVDQRDIRNALTLASQVTDRILLQLPPSDPRVGEDIIQLIWGVSTNLAEVDVSKVPVTQNMRDFCVQSAKIGLHSFAYGANSVGKALAARQAGFDYVGGYAVHETLTEPHTQSRFHPIFGKGGVDRNKEGAQLGKRSHPRFAPTNPNATVTLDTGKKLHCRILNASCSGVAVTTEYRPDIGAMVHVGAVAGTVVRHLENGFATQFLAVHPSDTLETALGSIPDNVEGLSLTAFAKQFA